MCNLMGCPRCASPIANPPADVCDAPKNAKRQKSHKREAKHLRSPIGLVLRRSPKLELAAVRTKDTFAIRAQYRGPTATRRVPILESISTAFRFCCAAGVCCWHISHIHRAACLQLVKADTRASPREKRAALAQHQRADRHPNANASQQHKHHGAQTIGPEYLFIAPVKIAGQPARLRTPARPVAAAMPAAPPRGALEPARLVPASRGRDATQPRSSTRLIGAWHR